MIEYLKIALNNKDFFTSIIILGLFVIIIIPLLLYIFNSIKKGIKELNETHIDIFDKQDKKIDKLYKDVSEHLSKHNEESQHSFARLALSKGNTVLDKEQTIRLLLTNMWYTSSGKLDYIKTILATEPLENRYEDIKIKISQELNKRSEEYVQEFKKYLVPLPNGDLACWLEHSFTEKDFNTFIDKIMNVIYCQKKGSNLLTTEQIIQIKLNEVSDIMKKLQNDLAKKLKDDFLDFNK